MMKPTTLTDAVTRTPPTRRGGRTMAFLRRRLPRWRGGVLGAVGLLAVGLAVPPPAAACSWYDPICWAEEVVDYFTDYVTDIENLARDVFTLDPEGAFYDLVDIGENFVCGGKLTVLDLIGANVVEA